MQNTKCFDLNIQSLIVLLIFSLNNLQNDRNA